MKVGYNIWAPNEGHGGLLGVGGGVTVSDLACTVVIVFLSTLASHL